MKSMLTGNKVMTHNYAPLCIQEPTSPQHPGSVWGHFRCHIIEYNLSKNRTSMPFDSEHNKEVCYSCSN